MGSFVAPVFLVPSLTLVLVAEILLDRPHHRLATTGATTAGPARPEPQPFLA